MNPARFIARSIIGLALVGLVVWTVFINIEFATADQSWGGNDIPPYPGGLCIFTDVFLAAALLFLLVVFVVAPVVRWIWDNA